MSTVREADAVALDIAKFFARQVRELAPQTVIRLFGSAARGERQELSDIDIYVELPDDADSPELRERISGIAWELGLEYGQVLQPITYGKGEVWDSPLRSSPFIKAVMREGIPL